MERHSIMKIQHMPYKCKGSNCKKEFIIEC
nr:MAG TPA: SWI5 BINDING MOTIF, ZINC FINGER [Caudoviricetes sp.]